MTQVDLASNTATISIASRKTFFFKSGYLLGHTDFDWCLVPPYPFRCVIARLIYGWYFNIKRVTSGDTEKTVQVTGPLPRGSFYTLRLPVGSRYYVNAHFVVGFSGDLADMHTYIKVSPLYFCIRKHFFQVFEGPGTVLLYGPSSIDAIEALEHQPARIVAFDINRRFTVVPPKPSTITSQLFNVLSHEVIWQFLDAGTTWVDIRSSHDDSVHRPFSVRGFIQHILGFIRI